MYKSNNDSAWLICAWTFDQKKKSIIDQTDARSAKSLGISDSAAEIERTRDGTIKFNRIAGKFIDTIKPLINTVDCDNERNSDEADFILKMHSSLADN